MNGLPILDTAKTPDGSLTGWTGVFVRFWHVAKVSLVEEADGPVAGGLRFGYQGGDALFFASQDFLSFEVAAIGDSG